MIGEYVRVIGVPPTLRPSQTRKIFEQCVGKVFPVQDINSLGWLELEVGEVVNRPAYMHSIWIEPRYVEKVER